jgi:glycosyltransferase involved in cell wall biosynthesis
MRMRESGNLALRVAIDATVLGSGRGGDETSLRGILAGLAEVTPDDGDTRYSLYLRPGASPPPSVAGSPVFPIYRIRLRPAPLRYLVTFPLMAMREPRCPSLLYSMTHTPLLSPAPMVLHLHDLSFVHEPRLYSQRTRLRLALSAPIHARLARAVFVPSDFTRQAVISTYGVARSKVFVVPNAIERQAPLAEQTDDEHRALLRRHGIDGQFFVYVGNLHPRKNLGRLIEAFARARRADTALGVHQLVIIGTEHRFYPRLASDGVAHALHQLSPGSVVFTGKLDDEERDCLVSAAVALAYPSLYEGFGIPPLEAMALGTPVLASTAASMPEVLGDAALLVDPRDVDAIARGLVRLATDAGLRSQMRTRGRFRAAHFSVRNTGIRALDAFRSALACAADRTHYRSGGVTP